MTSRQIDDFQRRKSNQREYVDYGKFVKSRGLYAATCTRFRLVFVSILYLFIFFFSTVPILVIFSMIITVYSLKSYDVLVFLVGVVFDDFSHFPH